MMIKPSRQNIPMSLYSPLSALPDGLLNDEMYYTLWFFLLEKLEKVHERRLQLLKELLR